MATTSKHRGSIESEASSLADELYAIELATTSGDYVKAEILNVVSVSEETIELDARLPNGQTESWELDKPIPWSDSFLFVRIMDEFDYGPANVEQLVGEEVLVQRDEDSWELKDPRTPTDFLEVLARDHRLKAHMLFLGMFVFPAAVGLHIISPKLATLLATLFMMVNFLIMFVLTR